MAELLTNDEVREALSLDFDYSDAEITDLAKAASSYIELKTGYDFRPAEGATVNPLAKRAAKMFVQMTFFGGQNYKKEYDFSFGLSAAISELQIVARNLTDAA